MLYISNAFSLSMLSDLPSLVAVREISADDVRTLLSVTNFTSAVGHESTAQVLSRMLGLEVAFNRIQVQLKKNDLLIVFQLLTRLEEGRVLSEEEVKALPHKFLLVQVF